MKASLTPALVDPTMTDRGPFLSADETANTELENAADFQGLVSMALNRQPAGTPVPGETAWQPAPDYYSATALDPDSAWIQNPGLNSRPAKSSAGKPDAKDKPVSKTDRKDSSTSDLSSSGANAAALAQTGVPAPLPPPSADGGNQTISADDQPGVAAAAVDEAGGDAQKAGPPTILTGGKLTDQPLHDALSPAALAAVMAENKDATPASEAQPAADGIAGGSPEATNIKTQAVDLQKLMMDKIGGSDPPQADGMAAALNRQHMKSSAETNEIAGATGQKVPRLAEVDQAAGGLAQNPGTGSGHNFSDSRKEPGVFISGLEISVQPGLMEMPRHNAVGDILPGNDTTAQIEQVTRLVNQEAVSVRQLGATSLAVSLKLDSHTELFLQLTNNDGQIQASLRCERGNIAGLNTHWGQLQESLARQNVQLLPLTDSGAGKTPGTHLFSGGSESRRFDQPPQSPQRQARAVLEPVNEDTTKSAPARGGKNQKPGRQGWESWA